MGRYCVPKVECFSKVQILDENWRLARIEAYSQAWEKMARYEPEDRYANVMLTEQKRLTNNGKPISQSGNN